MIYNPTSMIYKPTVYLPKEKSLICLSREQKKKVFLQLGRHYHLPIEIIYVLYQTNKTMEKEELQNNIDDYKSTYTVNIIMNRFLCRVLRGTDKPATEEDVLNFIFGGTDEVNPAGDMIEKMIKLCKKKCETEIQEIGLVDLKDYYSNYQELPFQTNRDALLREIERIGHPSILKKRRVYR